EEADRAREEARTLLEEHRALLGRARKDAEEILAEARRVAEAQRERVKEETEADRQRRLEETRREVQAETRRALEQIRAEVAELAAVIETPEFDAAGKAGLVGAGLEGADELVRNVVQLAIEKGRERELREIASAYNALLKEELGFLKVDLVTAVQLSPEEARPIVDQIGRATGRTVEASMKV